jgi:plasmid stabilization system protein ParE
VRVRFTAQARDDLETIIDVAISLDPQRAAVIQDDLVEAVRKLGSGWARYQIVAGSRLGDVRKKKCAPFVILYRVTDTVEILAIAHERSDWLRFIAEF